MPASSRSFHARPLFGHKVPNTTTRRAMAEQWGLPRYKFLAMPHPIANLTGAQLDQRAREIVPEVVKLLLKGQE